MASKKRGAIKWGGGSWKTVILAQIWGVRFLTDIDTFYVPGELDMILAANRLAGEINVFLKEKGSKIKEIKTTRELVLILSRKQKLPYPAYGKRTKNKTEDSEKAW